MAVYGDGRLMASLYIDNYRPWPDWIVKSNEEIARRFHAQIGTYPTHAHRDPGARADGGNAADFFLYDNSKAHHDEVLAWFRLNAKRLGATYIITWRRIWSVERASEGVRQYSGSDPHTGHFHVSYGTHSPTPEPASTGVPLMASASAAAVKVSYKGDQLLNDTEPHIFINAATDKTIVKDGSEGIDLTATIAIVGLNPKAGEFVDVWWSREWKKSGAADQIKGGDIPITMDRNGAFQVRYADKLSAADAGWIACLRLRYATNSKTAKVAALQVRGWKLT